MLANVNTAIEAVYRSDWGRIIATLIRLIGDFDVAEEAAQEAFAAAVDQWRESGVPQSPRTWLIQTARHKAIDVLRRRTRFAEKLQSYAASGLMPTSEEPDYGSAEIPDDRLRLIFTCCHPALAPEAQVALTLRTLGGLETEEIARAFLVPPTTMAQRLVRAKRKIRSAGIPYSVPDTHDMPARLDAVLTVLYLIFNEGYSATAGDHWMRPTLCEEALRLGRVLAELAPQEPEVHGLVALMEIQASRSAARVSPFGEPILLLDQDRSRWDQLLIRRGLAALERAAKLTGIPGPYALQAAIAACHVRANVPEATNWTRIVDLYTELANRTPSPIVELNRAVAVAMASGPAAGLELIDVLASEPALKSYHLLPAVRGDLLFKLNRFPEAQAEFTRAANLTRNARERDLLLTRAQAARERQSPDWRPA
jgi:RNA polymerase sigma factor (sigma-70 family)